LPQPLLKWGIAAAFILAVGFGAGRLASPAAADTASFRASLKSELRAELMAELTKQQDDQFAAFRLDADKKRRLDNSAIFAELGKMQLDHQVDLVALRRHLETVAVETQNSLQYEQQQIVNLAADAMQSK
jgi:hypothetical protein